MTSCRALTKSDTPCSRNALKIGYSAQHDKDAKIRMYRKELSKMHERVRRYLEITNELNDKLSIIQKVDFYKSELMKIGSHDRPYRGIIDSSFYKAEIEDLFGMKASAAHDEYDRLLALRNQLV
ncbi:hypothetical protein PHYSODRAFT_509873, partial [Phytophthora sojae]